MNVPPHVIAALKARAKALGPVSLRDQMWREAVQFHESAQRNFEQRVGPDGRYAFPFTAGVVGLAFACELYLKTLLLIAHGKAPHGHRLNVLFAKLPDDARALVKARYEQRRKGLGSVLEHDLVTFANAFVEFRYVYEGGNDALDIVGLGQLAASLYEASRRLNPDLQLYEYTHIRITSALQGVPIFSQGAHPYPPAPPAVLSAAPYAARGSIFTRPRLSGQARVKQTPDCLRSRGRVRPLHRDPAVEPLHQLWRKPHHYRGGVCRGPAPSFSNIIYCVGHD